MKAEGRAEMLLDVLEDRFGGYTDAQRGGVLAADSDRLRQWLLQALHADSVEAALGEP